MPGLMQISHGGIFCIGPVCASRLGARWCGISRRGWERSAGGLRPLGRPAGLIHVVARIRQRASMADRWPVADFLKVEETMNQIIWIVGLVVIVLFFLGYFGLR